MRFLLPLALFFGATVLSQGSPETAQPGRPAIPILKAEAVSSFDFNQLVNVVKNSRPMAGNEAPKPVTSLQDGLRHVQKAFNRPVVAMSESEGWYFYATKAMFNDQKNPTSAFFVSGYVIKRDSRQVVEWNV
jgi:hypothetical protein